MRERLLTLRRASLLCLLVPLLALYWNFLQINVAVSSEFELSFEAVLVNKLKQPQQPQPQQNTTSTSQHLPRVALVESTTRLVNSGDVSSAANAMNETAVEKQVTRRDPRLGSVAGDLKVMRIDTLEKFHHLIHKFNRGELCRRIFGEEEVMHFFREKQQLDLQIPPILINITFNAKELFNGQFGTGNIIWFLYGLRTLADVAGNVEISVAAINGERVKRTMALPWFTGRFPKTERGLPLANVTKPASFREVCQHSQKVPILPKLDDMIFEVRRAAIATVGIPHPNHPSAAFAEKYLYNNPNRYSNIMNPTGAQYYVKNPKRGDKPIYPNVEFDDVVLHFRCGDLVRFEHPCFGFMKFSSFSRHISPDARTIGIVTQPYKAGKFSRTLDTDKRTSFQQRCPRLVDAFLEHLQQRFPNATITVRNDPSEPITVTFARMVMANQTVIAISSFSVFPALATFGTAYIREPDFPHAPNRWLLFPNVETLVNNVFLIKDSKRLTSKKLIKLWTVDDGKKVLEWFKNDKIKYNVPEDFPHWRKNNAYLY